MNKNSIDIESTTAFVRVCDETSTRPFTNHRIDGWLIVDGQVVERGVWEISGWSDRQRATYRRDLLLSVFPWRKSPPKIATFVTNNVLIGSSMRVKGTVWVRTHYDGDNVGAIQGDEKP